MTLINNGFFTIEKGYTEQFIKLLIDQNMVQYFMNIPVMNMQ